MSEKIRLCKWFVVTDGGTYTVSEKEKDGILLADQKKARFVHLEDVVINIAFVKEMYRKYETRDTRYSVISEKEKKYIVAPKKEVKKLKGKK